MDFSTFFLSLQNYCVIIFPSAPNYSRNLFHKSTFQIFNSGNKLQKYILSQTMDDDEERFSDGAIDEFEEFKIQQFICTQPHQPRKTSKRTILKKEEVRLKMMKNDPVSGFEKEPQKKKQFVKQGKALRVGNAVFRSDFQSGNIESVQEVISNTYEISLQKETRSDRVSAWFYFRCEGLKGQVRFIIKGFTKSSSLYNEGMKICIQKKGQQWKRGGYKIIYTEAGYDQQNERSIYNLHFSYFFQDRSSVQFAYCFPYTYTKLLHELKQMENHLKIESLGKSYDGRDIPLLTIGNENSQKVIIISARVHPGETVSSFIMEGFLRELLVDSQYGIYLRQSMLFKVIPMINPDGVVHGNYRFSGAGFDLNRKWKKFSQKLHPQVYALKGFVKRLKKSKEILMFIDLHGHSRQKNVFFYGCCPKGSLNRDGKINSNPKKFPFLMSRLHHPFRYDRCCYKVQKEKQGTARIALWKQLNIDFVYTLESSFHGCDLKSNYVIPDYHFIGTKLCEGICLQFITEIEFFFSEKKMKFDSKLKERSKILMNDFYSNQSFVEVEFSNGSSDSEPEMGEVPQQERIVLKKATKGANKLSKGERIYKFINKEDLKNLFEGEATNIQHNKGNAKKQVKSQQIPIVKVPQQKVKKIIQIQFEKIEGGLRKQSKRKKTDTLYGSQPPFNQTMNGRLYSEEKARNKPNFSSSIPGEVAYKLRSEQLKEDIKRKGVSYESAQYRRVKKMAEQNKKKHFLATQGNFNISQNEESMIKGLKGMNNLIKMDKPVRSNESSNKCYHSQNRRIRKGSIQIHFRRQIKTTEYTNNKMVLNRIEGKQII